MATVYFSTLIRSCWPNFGSWKGLDSRRPSLCQLEEETHALRWTGPDPAWGLILVCCAKAVVVGILLINQPKHHQTLIFKGVNADPPARL